MDFGQALHALRNGQRVMRAGWNGKSMWLRLIKAHEWLITMPDNTHHMPRLPWIGMSTVQGDFVPWFASQTDMLAYDWEIYK